MLTSLWLLGTALTPAHAGDSVTFYDSRRQVDAEFVLTTSTSSSSSCASQDIDVDWTIVQGTPRIRSITLCDDTSCRLLSSREYYFQSVYGRVAVGDITYKGDDNAAQVPAYCYYDNVGQQCVCVWTITV